jgi:hypothetical protein
MQPDPFLERISSALADVPGLDAIALGGSRARGTTHAASDYDLGLYYSVAHPLDTDRLLEAVRALVHNPNAVEVTSIGGWGPWIVGGAWLSVEGRKLDLLYRNIEAVAQVIADCREGNISMHYQPGHPHGFCSAIWMGEIALCQPLHDPRGALAKLKDAALPYPPQLRDALMCRFQWEISFSADNAELALARGEQTHVAGCVYRALACVAQILFAVNEQYLINEKGALQEAANFPRTIPTLMSNVAEIWRLIGEQQFVSALATLRGMDRSLRELNQRA